MFACVIFSLLLLGASSAAREKPPLKYVSFYCDPPVESGGDDGKLDKLMSAIEQLDGKVRQLQRSLIDVFADVAARIEALQQNTLKQQCNGTSPSAMPATDSGRLVIDPLENDRRAVLAKTIPSKCPPRKPSGPQRIFIPTSELDPFFVYCSSSTDARDAARIVILRRRDGSTNFARDWNEYRRGFGNVEGDFFIGLDRLHAITQSNLHELWIMLEDAEKNTRWAKYSSFAIGDKSSGYAVTLLGTVSGSAGDGLRGIAGQKFTTPDNDSPADFNCGSRSSGAWWGGSSDSNGNLFGEKIGWNGWRPRSPIKVAQMEIRPL